MALLKQKGIIKIDIIQEYGQIQSHVRRDFVTFAVGLTISFVLPGNPKGTLLTGSKGGRGWITLLQ